MTAAPIVSGQERIGAGRSLLHVLWCEFIWLPFRMRPSQAQGQCCHGLGSWILGAMASSFRRSETPGLQLNWQWLTLHNSYSKTDHGKRNGPWSAITELFMSFLPLQNSLSLSVSHSLFLKHCSPGLTICRLLNNRAAKRQGPESTGAGSF